MKVTLKSLSTRNQYFLEKIYPTHCFFQTIKTSLYGYIKRKSGSIDFTIQSSFIRNDVICQQDLYLHRKSRKANPNKCLGVQAFSKFHPRKLLFKLEFATVSQLFWFWIEMSCGPPVITNGVWTSKWMCV